MLLKRVMKSCRSIHYLDVDFFHGGSLGIFLHNTSWFVDIKEIISLHYVSSCSVLKKIFGQKLVKSVNVQVAWSFPKSERKWGPIGLLSSWRKSFLQLQRVVASKGGKTQWSDRGYKCNLNNWKYLASIYKYCDGVQCDIFHIAMYVLVDKVWWSIFCNVSIS